MFVDLNDNFQIKAVENTMRKTTCLVCDVTLPVSGVDKTDEVPKLAG